MHRRKVKLCFNPFWLVMLVHKTNCINDKLLFFKSHTISLFSPTIYSPVISFLTFQRKVQMLVLGRTFHQAQLFNAQVTLKGFLD